MFQTAPAGTPVERNQSIAAWEHREVFPRNSMTGNYATLAGREAQFSFQVSPGEWIVPSMCRILVKLRLNRTEADNMLFDTGGAAAYQNLRFACAPTAALFSSMRFQSNGQTVEAVTNVHDLHMLRRRLTTRPGLKHGTLSCEHFDQRMHHRDFTKIASTPAKSKSGDNLLFTPDEMKNDKQQLLMEAVPLAVEPAAGDGYDHANIGNTHDAKMAPVEIAGYIPLSAFGTDKALPYGNYDLRATISSTCIEDAFFTDPAGILPVASGSGFFTTDQAGTDLKTTDTGGTKTTATNKTNAQTLARIRPGVKELDVATAAAKDKIKLDIDEIKLLIVVARPQADKVPRPSSWQCVYDRLQVFQRILSTGDSYTETISIPASTRLIFVDLASNQHALNINRELSGLTRNVKSLSLTYAGKVYPQPLYQVDMREGEGFSAARAYADFLDVVGADVTNPVSALSYRDYCRAPIFAFRILGEHLEASNSVTIRLSTHAATAATTDLRVFTASTVVWEQMGFTAAGATEQKIDEVVG